MQMNRLILAASLALGSTSCYMTKSGYDFTAAGQNVDSHWTVQSTFPRMGRFFLGYDSQRDGTYKDFAYARKQSVELTLRRHFLNHNPDNPNHCNLYDFTMFKDRSGAVRRGSHSTKRIACENVPK